MNLDRTCPNCGKQGVVEQSAALTRSSSAQNKIIRRYRMTCHSCKHRWRLWSSPPRPLCAICRTPGRVLETRVVHLTGVRRRRHECTNSACKHRWSTFIEPEDRVTPPSPLPKTGRIKVPDDIVYQLLLRTDLSHTAAGRFFNISRETVRHIRMGRSRLSAHPEIPRWGEPVVVHELTKGLTDEQLTRILTDRSLTNAGVRRMFGCSAQAASQIRLGQTHKERVPHIPRWNVEAEPVVQCTDCIHWGTPENPCRLGLPDPKEEGLSFASECATFVAS